MQKQCCFSCVFVWFICKKTERPGSDLDIVVKGVKDINKLKDEIDDIRTLTIINLFNYDKIKNNFLKEDIDAYAKIIY